MRLYKPPENTSPEAVALRRAAQAWVSASNEEAERANRVLLVAAVRYTVRVVSGLSVGELKRYTGDLEPWIQMLRSNAEPIGQAIRSLAVRR